MTTLRVFTTVGVRSCTALKMACALATLLAVCKKINGSRFGDDYDYGYLR